MRCAVLGQVLAQLLVKADHGPVAYGHMRHQGEETQGKEAQQQPDRRIGHAQLGGQAVLGVRPEAVTLSYEATAGAIPAVVELIEPMGSVNHVVLRFDGPGPVTVDDEPFVVVMRSNDPLEHGARVWATLLPDRLVLFDEQSGKALASLSPRREWCSVQSSSD